MKRTLTITGLILFLLATFAYNLGKEPLIEDEALRGLVALEMDYSGDYITPATGGEHYFRKPPLYNWFILGFFKLSGSYSEFVLRLPMLLSLLGFAATLFLYVRKHFSQQTALLSALILLTNGRILFYESLHGLIDITFSWVVFFQIIVIYEYSRQGRFRQMFLLSYLLAATGFMLKGMQVVPFQGITILLALIMNKSWKTIFNRWHFLAAGMFLVLIGSYFYAYYTKNPAQTGEYLSTFLHQGASRAIFANSLREGITHILTYPFRVVYHFLPWTLFGLLLLSRKVRRAIFASHRQRFFMWAFVFNILVYWLSPVVYPRYIIMLIPVALIPLADQYLKQEYTFVRQFRSWFEWIIGGIMIIAIPATMGFNFLKVFQEVDGLLVKTIGAVIVLTVIAFRFFQLEHLRVFIIIIALLFARLFFNSIILPQRWQSEENRVVHASEKIVEKTGDKPLYSFYDPERDRQNYHKRLKHKYEAHYYLEVFKGELIPVKTKLEDDGFYLAGKEHLKYLSVEVHGKYIYHKGYKPKYLVRKKKKYAF